MSVIKIKRAATTEQAEHPDVKAETVPGKNEDIASLDTKKVAKETDKPSQDNQDAKQTMIKYAGTMRTAQKTSAPTNICP